MQITSGSVFGDKIKLITMNAQLSPNAIIRNKLLVNNLLRIPQSWWNIYHFL